MEFLVDGRPQPVVAWRMPRSQVAQEHRAAGGDPRAAYKSGFWGFIELRPEMSGQWELGVRCWVGGEPYVHQLGIVRGRPAEPRATTGTSSSRTKERPLIAVCMATYNPEPHAFAVQVESIRSQTYGNWVCLINDDCSTEEAFAGIHRVIGADERFTIHRNSERLGFYRNFEAVLRRVPAEVDYVALSDQDDRWYAQKLETLLQLVQQPGTVLAYSDMRIVERDGRVLRDSFWNLGRRNNQTDLGALLCANSVTGAAALFERRVLDVALPFPWIRGQYHDHWLACVALALGHLAYTDQPLHDYIQHGGNVLGHSARPGPENSGSRAVQQWYFVNVIGSMMFARELRLRLGPSDGQRNALDAMSELDGSRGAGALIRRSSAHPFESRSAQIAAALGWRWLMRVAPYVTWRRLSVTKAGYPSTRPGGWSSVDGSSP